MKRKIQDPLKALTGFTCGRCGKELVGWVAGKNPDGSPGNLCNQCRMLLQWIEGYNQQQSHDSSNQDSA